MSDSVLSFELKLNSKPVTMTKEDGSKVTYTLRELSGQDRDNFVQEMTNRIDVKEKIVKDYIGLQASLLSRALYNEEDVRLTVKEVQQLPSKVMNVLYSEAQKLSDLEDDEDEPEDEQEDDSKND